MKHYKLTRYLLFGILLFKLLSTSAFLPIYDATDDIHMLCVPDAFVVVFYVSIGSRSKGPA